MLIWYVKGYGSQRLIRCSVRNCRPRINMYAVRTIRQDGRQIFIFHLSYMLNGKKFRLIVACLFSLLNTLCDKIMGELYCSHDKVEPLKLRSRPNLWNIIYSDFFLSFRWTCHIFKICTTVRFLWNTRLWLLTEVIHRLDRKNELWLRLGIWLDW